MSRKFNFSLFTCLFFTTGILTYGQSPLYRFAVIGDYGKAGINEYSVSVMVKSWNPAFIITTGDNNYELGQDSTIDSNIGQYYHEFISPYYGGFGLGDTVNRFFPCLGNHDWYTTGAIPYLNYFTLPGNERYYVLSKPPIQFFVIDSDTNEPHGVTSSSIQGQWLQSALASSSARFKIVYFHHASYSSGEHGSTTRMQWPFRSWGASIVLNGHDHDYERLYIGSFPYIVNGLGGKSIYTFGSPVSGSIIRYNANYGAQLVSVWLDSVNFKFYAIPGTLIDSYTLVYTPTLILINSNVPEKFHLYQNSPNPFNPAAKIKFDIPSAGKENELFVRLMIYDILGKEIATLVNEHLEPGSYEAGWNASNFPSAMYIYRLTAGDFSESRRMVLLK